MQNADIRDIDPTTRRLVERCLGGEWCVQFRTANKEKDKGSREGSPGSDSVASAMQAQPTPSQSLTTSMHPERSGSLSKSKTLKTSKSHEHLKGGASQHQQQRQAPRSALENLRRPSNASSLSLTGVTSAATPTVPSSNPHAKRREKVGASSLHNDLSFSSPPDRHPTHPPTRSENGVADHHHHLHPTALTTSLPTSPALNQSMPVARTSQRRSAPPAPTKRRKPPAIPVVGRTHGGATITAIKSSASVASSRSQLI